MQRQHGWLPTAGSRKRRVSSWLSRPLRLVLRTMQRQHGWLPTVGSRKRRVSSWRSRPLRLVLRASAVAKLSLRSQLCCRVYTGSVNMRSMIDWFMWVSTLQQQPHFPPKPDHCAVLFLAATPVLFAPHTTVVVCGACHKPLPACQSRSTTAHAFSRRRTRQDLVPTQTVSRRLG